MVYCGVTDSEHQNQPHLSQCGNTAWWHSPFLFASITFVYLLILCFYLLLLHGMGVEVRGHLVDFVLFFYQMGSQDPAWPQVSGVSSGMVEWEQPLRGSKIWRFSSQLVDWEELGGVALLEKVCHWEWDLPDPVLLSFCLCPGNPM